MHVLTETKTSHSARSTEALAPFGKDFTASERVVIGEAIEQELEGRVGRPAAETKENFPELPQGQTRDLAAKAAGFGNGKSYEQAKRLTYSRDTAGTGSTAIRRLIGPCALPPVT